MKFVRFFLQQLRSFTAALGIVDALSLLTQLDLQLDDVEDADGYVHPPIPNG